MLATGCRNLGRLNRKLSEVLPSNPSLYKSSYLSEKNILITRSISTFISVIYLSIKITIKELMAKNGGHFNPGKSIIKKFWPFVFGPCFVMYFFVSFLVLQLSC